MQALAPSKDMPSQITQPTSGLLGQVGNTPLFRLRHIAGHLPSEVELHVKAEWYNPSGSVKDRPASAIIRTAMLQGDLSRDKVLLDSTSGNMGIAYATFAAALNLQVHLAIPANASQERLSILRALGTELTLTDPLEGSNGAQYRAAEIFSQHPERYFYADQYSNPANWRAHYETTGPEILRQTEGRITHFVAGLGTTGTFVGTGRSLKDHSPGVCLVAVQPDGPLHGLEGLKHLESTSIPPIFDPSLVGTQIQVPTERAFRMARRLARQEGLLAGVSSCAALAAALEIAERLDRGVVVALLPDSGARYLDQPFWREE